MAAVRPAMCPGLPSAWRGGDGGQRAHPQRLRPLPARQDRAEPLAVTGLIEDGKLIPAVGPTCPLAETAYGLRTVEQQHARGNR